MSRLPSPVGAEVCETFRRVAPRYDFLNHTLSGGLDWYWRWQLMRAVRRQKPMDVLDVATGTGDVALGLRRGRAYAGRCVGADFCEPMLQRAQAKGVSPLCVADGLRLPFRAESFAAITLAFGLRNVEDRLAGLREMRRVLQPGGKLYVLEFSHPARWFRGVYDWYLRHLLPRIAAGFGSHEASYVYLCQSIQAFPNQEALKKLLHAAGFHTVQYRNLTGGVVALHIASV